MTENADAPEPTDTGAAPAANDDAAALKTRFSKAIDDARASADALRAEAVERAQAAAERAQATASEWSEAAGTMAGQARDKGIELAEAGKAKTSEAIAAVGRSLAETAPVIDEKLGVTYGDYARAAADALESSAGRLAEKDFAELGEDVREFVRKSPATALGIAAVAGFFLGRLFTRSGRSDA